MCVCVQVCAGVCAARTHQAEKNAGKNEQKVGYRAVMEFKELLLERYMSLMKCLLSRPEESEILVKIHEETCSKQSAQCGNTGD